MTGKKYPNSFYDCDGKLAVFCSECTRGYNGKLENKCACGGMKKPGQDQQYCFIGTLMPEIDKLKLRQLPRVIMHQLGNNSICDDGSPCRGVDKCAGYEQCQSTPNIARQIIRENIARNQKIDIDDTGTLDVGSETPCPNCGEDLGYYAELVNHEVTCDNCGHTFEIKPSEDITWRRIK